MKKYGFRIPAMLLLVCTALCSLAACGQQTAPLSDPQRETAESAVENTVDAAQSGGEEGEQVSAAETVEEKGLEKPIEKEEEVQNAADSGKELPALIVTNRVMQSAETIIPKDNDAIDECPYGVVRFPYFAVSDETADLWPELSFALGDLNMEFYSRAQSALAEEVSAMQDSLGYEDMPLFCSNEQTWTANVLRADDRILSIAVSEEIYYNGAAHPFTDYKSVSIDTATGEQIDLPDAVTETEGLAQIIFDNLEVMDEEYQFSDSEKSTILETIETMIKENRLPWTLDEQGLNVYFNAYDLMYYAFGPIFATMTYEKYPDLITQKYLPLKTKAAKPLIERVTYGDEPEENHEIWAAEDILKYLQQ